MHYLHRLSLFFDVDSSRPICYKSSYVCLLHKSLTAHRAQYTEFFTSMVLVISKLEEYIVHIFPLLNLHEDDSAASEIS